MIVPAKVIGFLDISGSWDPSLAFVMGGAVLVTSVGFAVCPPPSPSADRREISVAHQHGN